MSNRTGSVVLCQKVISTPGPYPTAGLAISANDLEFDTNRPARVVRATYDFAVVTTVAGTVQAQPVQLTVSDPRITTSEEIASGRAVVAGGSNAHATVVNPVSTDYVKYLSTDVVVSIRAPFASTSNYPAGILRVWMQLQQPNI